MRTDAGAFRNWISPVTRILEAPTERSVESITEKTAICRMSGESSGSATICMW